jgi:hypothetical protein
VNAQFVTSLASTAGLPAKAHFTPKNISSNNPHDTITSNATTTTDPSVSDIRTTVSTAAKDMQVEVPKIAAAPIKTTTPLSMSLPVIVDNGLLRESIGSDFDGLALGKGQISAAVSNSHWTNQMCAPTSLMSLSSYPSSSNSTFSIKGLSPAVISKLAQSSGTPLHLAFDRLCLRSNLRSHVLPGAETILGTGGIYGSDHEELARLANALILKGGTAVMRRGALLIIVFPTIESASQYAFLGRPERSRFPCQLSIQVREVADGRLQKRSLAPQNAPRSIHQLFRCKFNIDDKVFFSWTSKPQALAKNVFLMLGDGRVAETEMMSRYFREIGATVWTNTQAGSWAAFRAQGEGVVVVSVKAPRSKLHDD